MKDLGTLINAVASYNSRRTDNEPHYPPPDEEVMDSGCKLRYISNEEISFAWLFIYITRISLSFCYNWEEFSLGQRENKFLHTKKNEIKFFKKVSSNGIQSFI